MPKKKIDREKLLNDAFEEYKKKMGETEEDNFKIY